MFPKKMGAKRRSCIKYSNYKYHMLDFSGEFF